MPAGYEPYIYNPALSYDMGWDKYALKYATLLKPETLYYLHKQVMYDYLDKHILPSFSNKPLTVLDVNCGCGNDFPYWLKHSEKLVGIDGSAGMLNKAYENYREFVERDKLSLYIGKLENLNAHSLREATFDIIYSITGGFSYIPDKIFEQKIKVLHSFLNPGGVMITAHLTTFCPSETIAFLLQWKAKRAFVRLKKKIPVGFDSEMQLRNRKRLKDLFSKVFESVDTRPLIALTPPYQTNISISPTAFALLRKCEGFCTEKKILTACADQIIVTCRKK